MAVAAGTPSVGLNVEGTRCPIRKLTLVDGVGANFALAGVTSSSLPAGSHELTMGFDCPSGTLNTASLTSTSVLTAILLGQ